MVHNDMFGERPLAVMRAEQVADVVAAMNLAATRARAGRPERRTQRARIWHQRRRSGDRHDTMRTVHVDPRNKMARADAGATLGDLTTQPTHSDWRQRAASSRPRHHRPDPRRRYRLPVAGMWTFHRQPPLRRCGHRRRKVPHRQPRENEDLFWGSRWRRELRHSDLAGVPATRGGPGIRRSDLLQPGGRRLALRMFDEFIQDAPEQFGGFRVSRLPRPCPSSRKTGTATHSPWRSCIGRVRSTKPKAPSALLRCRSYVANGTGPLPYPALNSAFDALYPKGIRAYWKGAFVEELPDEAIAAHVEHGSRVPEVSATMHLYPSMALVTASDHGHCLCLPRGQVRHGLPRFMD